MTDYIYYGGRIFRAVSTEGDGDVGRDTIFRYEQRDNILIGTYSGGEVEYGTIVGTVHYDGRLTFLYQHITKTGELRSGSCVSTPEWVDGRLRLNECWHWHAADGAGSSGTSIIEEL